MAKVTMYRGIDLMDGQDSYLALCDGLVARSSVGTKGGAKFATPETFGDFHEWESMPIDDEDRETLANCEVLWEADL